MSILRKIAASYAVMLVIALACAGLAVWTANTSRYYLDRSNLAHQSYEAHLRLSISVTKLFKEYQKSLLIGADALPELEEELITEIQREVSNIRGIVSAEVSLAGGEELEEYEAFARLEARIQQVLRRYEREFQVGSREKLQPFAKETLSLVNDEIKVDIYNDIDLALADEIKEVEEAREFAMAMVGRSQALALTFAFLAALCAGLGIYLLGRNVARPLQQIAVGAREFADGNYEYSIDTEVGGELGQVADAVNEAASLAAERQDNLENANEALEIELKQQNEELRRSILSLEEQRHQRQLLLADVSHELRTPLTVIQGEADIALRGKDKNISDYKDALRRASEAAQHTAQLVQDLLFIGRQEADRARLNYQRHDLVELAKATVDTVTSIQEIRGAKISLDLTVQEAFLPMDVSRIRQVIMILLENATQYGGNEIRVRIHSSPGGYAFSVKDNGPGIANEDQDRIFSRFFRGSDAAKRYEAGAGLGLPVAKSIVEAHNGTISVSSRIGDGAEFKVILPSGKPIKAVS